MAGERRRRQHPVYHGLTSNPKLASIVWVSGVSTRQCTLYLPGNSSGKETCTTRPLERSLPVSTCRPSASVTRTLLNAASTASLKLSVSTEGAALTLLPTCGSALSNCACACAATALASRHAPANRTLLVVFTARYSRGEGTLWRAHSDRGRAEGEVVSGSTEFQHELIVRHRVLEDDISPCVFGMPQEISVG